MKTVPKKRHLLSFLSASVFGRFIVDSRRKRTKKFAFSYENGLVRTGQNKSKTGEAEIFSFVLVLVWTKTDTFEERISVVGVLLIKVRQ